jgi:hypothetical protein
MTTQGQTPRGDAALLKAIATGLPVATNGKQEAELATPTPPATVEGNGPYSVHEVFDDEKFFQVTCGDRFVVAIDREVAGRLIAKELNTLAAENKRLREALAGVLEIATFRWRNMPADSPEKVRMAAARTALAGGAK